MIRLNWRARLRLCKSALCVAPLKTNYYGADRPSGGFQPAEESTRREHAPREVLRAKYALKRLNCCARDELNFRGARSCAKSTTRRPYTLSSEPANGVYAKLRAHCDYSSILRDYTPRNCHDRSEQEEIYNLWCIFIGSLLFRR